MPSFLSRLVGWLLGRPNISCPRHVWEIGVRELERRTLNGTRESGAFLLGRVTGGQRRITDFVYYDDIDPHALDTGIVHFSGNKLPVLWALCRKKGYGVVADVHVHPGSYGQSNSDRANPVMPRSGHIAFIIPDFARREIEPGKIGMYEYLGDGRWRDFTLKGRAFFHLEKP
jgi:hypothetical protein